MKNVSIGYYHFVFASGLQTFPWKFGVNFDRWCATYSPWYYFFCSPLNFVKFEFEFSKTWFFEVSSLLSNVGLSLICTCWIPIVRTPVVVEQVCSLAFVAHSYTLTIVVVSPWRIVVLRCTSWIRHHWRSRCSHRLFVMVRRCFLWQASSLSTNVFGVAQML